MLPGDLQLAFDVDDEQVLDAFRSRDRFETRPMNNFELSKRCDFDVRRWSGDSPQDRMIISVETLDRTNWHFEITDPRGRTLSRTTLH